MGGRQDLFQQLFIKCYSIIVFAKNSLTRRIIQAKHFGLLLAGPTLAASSLARCFHIMEGGGGAQLFDPSHIQ